LTCGSLEVDPWIKWASIQRGIGKEWQTMPVTAMSPSGEWMAWAEWTSDVWSDGGRIQLYLAPTANLLKP
jgi:hypothetical protein